MDRLDLLRVYNSEEKCIKLFKFWRDNNGVKCKRCSGTQHLWLSTRKRYRCKNCKWETTLRSGTALECSKLPYRYWVYAAILMSYGKKPISAKELQGLLGHKYYLPVWTLLQKLRVSMGLMSEMAGMAKIVRQGVAVMPALCQTAAGKDGRTIHAGVKGVKVCLDAIDAPDMLRSDFSPLAHRFSQIRMHAACCSLHSPTRRFTKLGKSLPDEPAANHQVADIEDAFNADVSGKLSWIQIMAFNARRNFLGIYHNISEKYFQNYLAEFCFLTNRRYLGQEKFKSLLELMVRQPWHNTKVQLSAYSGGPDSLETQ